LPVSAARKAAQALELVTLRLPAPKEGFWSRVFGRKKKELAE